MLIGVESALAAEEGVARVIPEDDRDDLGTVWQCGDELVVSDQRAGHAREVSLLHLAGSIGQPRDDPHAHPSGFHGEFDTVSGVHFGVGGSRLNWSRSHRGGGSEGEGSGKNRGENLVHGLGVLWVVVVR